MIGRSVEEWIGATPDTAIPPRVRLRVFEKRFLEKTIPEPMSGCWLWMGACSPKGYGHMHVDGRFIKAHRFSYALYCCDVPTGAQICHRCDNPSCVNPEHLWAGTVQENLNDCIAKGRFRTGSLRGDQNPSSKLSDADVRAIRLAPRGYGTGIALARRYGVRQATISEIRSGKQRRV